jgi:hypothetical protein
MVDYLAPPTLRLLGKRATGGVFPASGDDIKNLNTTNLPDRALVWVGSTLMVLDKDDNTSAEQLSGSEPIVIVPNSGPGRWKAISGEGISDLNFQIHASAFDQTIVVTGADEWSIMPSLTWVPLSGRAGLFNEDANGRITYNGPSQDFWVGARVSVSNATGANAAQIELANDLNGALVGTTGAVAQAAVASTGADQQIYELYAEYVRTLTPGDVIGMVFRSDNGDDFTLVRGVLTLKPHGIKLN